MRYQWSLWGGLLVIALIAATVSAAIHDPIRPHSKDTGDSASTQPAAEGPGTGDTPTTSTTTTTMNPFDEFCAEACRAGVGGPECRCPNHPIG